ncbi:MULTISPECIES: ABC transporter substrate-binding protein [Mycolicibacterium]|uniref:ABC transporter substrate-binding protein n=1 Tax=Mycolicibacterium monacense TaxID=85693 RepID=UPI0007EA867D|nr:ABC transporter substrate-binding protein [Mycolicibacterium monacense]OBB62557.1 nitrate ABC transporter substrate-binding protein [Mycolicibacterium monacense]
MSSSNFRRLTAVLAVTTAVSAGCSGSGGGGDTAALKVGIVCGGISLAALTIDEGKIDGVDAEQVCFDSGSDAVQALSGGSIDAFIGAGEHVVRNRIKGLEVKGYAVLSHTPPYSLVSSSESPVREVSELAGKTVAVTAPGSLSDTELQRAAAESGVDYDSIRVIGAGTGATMQATIEKGGAAAGMVTDPTLTTMLQSGRFQLTWKPEFPYIALAVIAKQSWADAHRDTLAAFVQGARATQERSLGDLPAAVAVAEKQAPGLDRTILEEVVETTLEQAPEGLVVPEPTYADTVALLEEVGQVDKGKAPAFGEAFDFSLLESP